MHRNTTLTVLVVLLANACAEPNADPTLPAARPEPAIGSKAGSLAEFRLLVRKHGKAKRFRGTVDPQQHTIQLTSIIDPACYPDDPTCNGDPQMPCALDDPACSYGTYPATGIDSVYIENPPALSDAWYDSGPWICPAYVDDPHFEHKGHHFQIDGRAERVAFLPMVSGVPKARYRLPPGPWLSDDEQMRIWSGFIDGTCWVREELWFGFLRVHVGEMGWYKFTGTAEDLTFWGGGQGQAQDGVWVSYGGDGGGSYMDPEAARVLDRYIKEGVCTPGWVIFVNGAQVC